MPKKRIEKVAEKLKKDGYIFDCDGLLSALKSKFTEVITKDSKLFFLGVIIDESSPRKDTFLNEINFLDHFGENYYLPKLIEYSKEDLYLVREDVGGTTAGNVYFFNSQIMLNNQFIGRIVNRFQTIWSLPTYKSLPSFNYNIIYNNLERIASSKTKGKEFASKILSNFQSKQSILDKEKSYLIHGDLQPTNILINDLKINLIDFEAVSEGPIYYDIASAYHRLDKFAARQSEYKECVLNYFKRSKKHFDQSLFDLFYSYYLLIDIDSLEDVYINKIKKPFHHTEISETEATELQNLYMKKISALI